VRLFCDDNDALPSFTCASLPAVNCIDASDTEVKNLCDYAGPGTYTPKAELWTRGTNPQRVRVCDLGGNAVCNALPSCNNILVTETRACQLPSTPELDDVQATYSNVPSSGSTLQLKCKAGDSWSSYNLDAPKVSPQPVPPKQCSYSLPGTYTVSGRIVVGSSTYLCPDRSVPVNCADAPPGDCIDYV
jgi:hypothetical protein